MERRWSEGVCRITRLLPLGCFLSSLNSFSHEQPGSSIHSTFSRDFLFVFLLQGFRKKIREGDLGNLLERVEVFMGIGWYIFLFLERDSGPLVLKRKQLMICYRCLLDIMTERNLLRCLVRVLIKYLYNLLGKKI